jgi:hypothetical protein
MKRYWSFAAIFVSLSSLPAGVIDVASRQTQGLHSGDTLAFLFTDASFAANAANFGLSSSPASVSFNLMSAPVAGYGQFAATLESIDGSASAAFAGPLGWTNGWGQWSGYSGSVSDLGASMSLPAAMSQQIFANNKAMLLLTYSGPDITLGVGNRTLEQDFSFSVSGGGLSTGTVNYDVTLSDNTLGAVGGSEPVTAAPEPGSGLLLGGFAAVLLAAILGKRRSITSRATRDTARLRGIPTPPDTRDSSCIARS